MKKSELDQIIREEIEQVVSENMLRSGLKLLQRWMPRLFGSGKLSPKDISRIDIVRPTTRYTKGPFRGLIKHRGGTAYTAANPKEFLKQIGDLLLSPKSLKRAMPQINNLKEGGRVIVNLKDGGSLAFGKQSGKIIIKANSPSLWKLYSTNAVTAAGALAAFGIDPEEDPKIDTQFSQAIEL